MRIYKQFIKRPLDVIGALILMILTFPLFVLVWILIKIFMGSPVILPQKRAGHHGKIFTLYKFRTMSFEKSPSGKLLPDEMRITKLGAFLRKTSLDEIPQFYNVLKGDMSFIGPRPFMECEIKALSKKSRRSSRTKRAGSNLRAERNYCRGKDIKRPRIRRQHFISSRRKDIYYYPHKSFTLHRFHAYKQE